LQDKHERWRSDSDCKIFTDIHVSTDLFLFVSRCYNYGTESDRKFRIRTPLVQLACKVEQIWNLNCGIGNASLRQTRSNPMHAACTAANQY